MKGARNSRRFAPRVSAVDGRLDVTPGLANLPRMQYRVTLIDSDEGWAVWCDQFPGCCSQGATREEALANIREAIVEYREAQAVVHETEFGVRSVQHETISI